MYDWQGNQPAPEFDLSLAESYIGKVILVGLTYYANDGTFLEQVQFHGVVESVSSEGLQVALRGKRSGENWMMPPNLESISVAAPGIYTLRSTGEEVENPDLLSTWTVTNPASS